MDPSMQEGLRLAIVGVGAVFSALIVTGILVALVGRILRDRPSVPAAKKKPLPDVAYGGIDKHVLVLLAAAASVAVKRPVRIRRVRFVSHMHAASTWAAAGRAEHEKEAL